MKNVFCLFIILSLFQSCTTKKVLLKGQNVYSYSLSDGSEIGTEPVVPSWTYIKYEVLKRKEVKITEVGTYLIIKDDPSKDLIHYKSVVTVGKQSSTPPVWKNENIGNGYFPESQDALASESFWYREDKMILQTASVPIKIRAAIRRPELGDSIPSQTETGVNIGFLVGYKISWNKFRTSANSLAQTTVKYSVTGGPILSVGAADLSATATRPKIEFPRKATMITMGGSVVFGFNNVHLGYAFGRDQALGRSASTWLYQGKMWNGVIVSLDLIK